MEHNEMLITKFADDIDYAAKFGENISGIPYEDMRQFAVEKLLSYAESPGWFGGTSAPLSIFDGMVGKSARELEVSDVLYSGDTVRDVLPTPNGVYVETDEIAEVFYDLDYSKFFVKDQSADSAIHGKVKAALYGDVKNAVRDELRDPAYNAISLEALIETGTQFDIEYDDSATTNMAEVNSARSDYLEATYPMLWKNVILGISIRDIAKDAKLNHAVIQRKLEKERHAFVMECVDCIPSNVFDLMANTMRKNMVSV